MAPPEVTPRRSQFYIDIVYGIAFIAGFAYLAVVEMDARVAAFEGGIVIGYFLRVWEKMTMYEQALSSLVSEEAERQVATEIEEQVTPEVEEKVGAEVEAKVEPEVKDRVAEELDAEVEDRLEEGIEDRLATEVADRVADEVEEQLGPELEEQLAEELDEIEQRLDREDKKEAAPGTDEN